MTFDALLKDLVPKIQRIEAEMAGSEALSDLRRMRELAREFRRLTDLRDLRDRLVAAEATLDELRDAAGDPELAALAEEEIAVHEQALEALETRIRRLLIPDPPEDARNAVLEIRAGTGGDEAGLFASDLYKMYLRFFDQKGWKVQLLNGHFSELGGAKEVILSVVGEGAYGRLKFESGVHRVQRVPLTEASGRIHTSAATVAVLPEAEEVDVQIDPKDLKIDTYRSSGPGGQHVNKTDSAIRITHLPTGLVVTCQDEKSQHKNKAQALKVLRSRLYQQELEETNAKRAAERRSKVSTGDRSAKIRTYNFPQGRVTDHRPPVTIYRLEEVLSGDVDLIIDPVADFFVEQALAEAIKGETHA